MPPWFAATIGHSGGGVLRYLLPSGGNGHLQQSHSGDASRARQKGLLFVGYVGGRLVQHPVRHLKFVAVGRGDTHATRPAGLVHRDPQLNTVQRVQRVPDDHGQTNGILIASAFFLIGMCS